MGSQDLPGAFFVFGTAFLSQILFAFFLFSEWMIFSPQIGDASSFGNEPDATKPPDLMMFATQPRPSRRCYCNEPPVISRPSRRPVAVSTTHSTKPACGDRACSVNLAFSTPPILQFCVSYQDKRSLLSSVLVSARKAAHVQSSPGLW